MWPAVLCRADTTQLYFNPRAVLTCLLPMHSLAGTDCASLLGADIGLDNRMINCVNCLAIRGLVVGFWFCFSSKGVLFFWRTNKQEEVQTAAR